MYLGVRFFGTLAAQIQSVAVGWQVYDLTNSAVALGYVGLVEFVPMVLICLPAGDVADRVDRRLLMAATYVIQAVASALLLTLSLAGSHQIWQFYLVIALFGVARGISTPAMQSTLPFIVTTDKLPQAIAWSSSALTVATISGPALGGLLYTFGPAPNYAGCLLLFIFATIATAILKLRQNAGGPVLGTAYGRIVDGISYIWKRPILFGAISLDLFAVLAGAVIAVLPVYARDILVIGPVGLGALRSAPAVGAAMVAFVLGRWPLKRDTGAVMFASVAIFGVATIVFGISRDFYLSVLALGVTGAADMVSVLVRSTFVQLGTPDALRGRVSAVNSLFISASNEMGQFKSGMAAGWLGIVPSVVAGGLGTLAIVGVWLWLFPQLRRVDHYSEVAVS